LVIGGKSSKAVQPLVSEFRAGSLTNLGQSDSVKVRIWSSQQSAVAGRFWSDSTRVVVPQQYVNMTDIDSIAVADSIASNTSTDTFIVRRHVRAYPGSKIQLVLPEGFQFSFGTADAAANTSIRMTIDGEGPNADWTSITTTEEVRTGTAGAGGDTLEFTISDTLRSALASGKYTDFNDSLLIEVGNGVSGSGAEGITNIISDSVTTYAGGRRHGFRGFIVRILDEYGKLMQSNDTLAVSASGDMQDSLVVVTNRVIKALPRTAAGVDNMVAGASDDTLGIWFQLAQPLDNSGTITFKFRGFDINTDSVVDETKFNFKGDTSGPGSFGHQDFIVSDQSDSTFKITLAAGDVLGTATNGAWLCSLAVGNVFRNLGAKTLPSDSAKFDSVASTGAFEVVMTTSDQSAEMTYTSTSNFTINEVATDENSFGTPGTDNLVGANPTSLTMGWTDGAAQGFFPKNGIIEITIPTLDDTSRGRHEFQISNLDAYDVTLKYGIASSKQKNVGSDLGGSVTTTTLGGSSASTSDDDSTKIVIDLRNTSTDFVDIESADSLVVVISGAGGHITNPYEASEITDLNNLFAPTNPSTPGASKYKYSMMTKDSRGNIINRTNGSFNTVQKLTTSKLLVLVDGEKHEAGTTYGKRGAPEDTTVNRYVTYAVLATDAYGNLDATETSNITISSATDINAIVIDSNSTNAGHISLAGGYYQSQGTFKFQKAADGVDSLGRGSSYNTIKATDAAAALTAGTSSNITVKPLDFSRIAVTIPDYSVTLAPGDTAKDGKNKFDYTSVSLPKDARVQIVAFAVDSFYNRVAELTSGSALNVQAKNSIVYDSASTVQTNAFDFDKNGSLVFTIDPDTTSTGNTVTVTHTSLSISGYHTFAVVQATIYAAFSSIDDSTDDAGEDIDFTFKAAYDGYFAPGTGWAIYLFGDTNRTVMDVDNYGGTLISFDGEDYLTTGEGVSGGEANAVTYTGAADTKEGTEEGEDYWLYATMPSSGSDTVWAVSERFYVKHWPIVNTTLKAITPSTLDTTLNSGADDRTFTIDYKVTDYDAGFSEVKVFLDTISTRTLADLILTGESPSYRIDSLATAVEIGTSESLTLEDTTYTFDILSPDNTSLPQSDSYYYMPKGDWYVYIVTNDGKHQDVERSSSKIKVKHSPTMTLDRPVTGTKKLDTKDQVKLTVGWSLAGDQDIDDSATIAIYYDTTGKDWSYADEVINGGTQISNGFEINEDDDTEHDDMYLVELDSMSSSDLPISGGVYDFYALIKDDQDTVVVQSPGSVEITHSPNLQFLMNFGGSLGKGSKSNIGDDQVKISKGEILRIPFNAWDLKLDQYIRLVISQQDNATYSGLVFPNEAGTTTGWVMNSTNGQDDASSVIELKTTASSYNWNSGNMTTLTTDGDYYIYAFVTNYTTDTNPSDWAAAEAAGYIEKFTSSGKLNISGTAGFSSPNILVSPNVVPTNAGDQMTLEVKVNTGGNSVQTIEIYMDVPDTLFELVDQDATTDGIQPFIVNSTDFFGDITALVDTVYTGKAGTTYVDFRKSNYASGSSSTDTTLFSIVVRAKGTQLPRAQEGYISFSLDATEGRKTDMDLSMISVPSNAVRVQSMPLGRITGVVPLEGRNTDASKQITMEVRPYGSEIPITDSDFISKNDVNDSKAGVQVNTNTDGYYELYLVPTGKYDIVAKSTNYLSGMYPNLWVVPGDLQVGINPTQDENEVDYLELRGGDVRAKNATGTQDNQVTLEDVNFISLPSVFLQDTTTVGYGDLGDVNGNGIVDLQDLTITSSNINQAGVPPVFNQSKRQSIDNSDARLEVANVPDLAFKGDEFEAEIIIHNAGDVFGYMFALQYDPNAITLVDGETSAFTDGDFLQSVDGYTPVKSFTVDSRKGLVYVSTILGSKEISATGDGLLLKARFRVLEDNTIPQISLTNVELANSVSEITKLGDVMMVPTDYALRQNYPNPFNPETHIRYQIPDAGRVSLKIYNILGQEVKTLVNTDLNAGYHIAKWDGTNDTGIKVASGIYIYRLKTGNFVASKKMIFLK